MLSASRTVEVLRAVGESSRLRILSLLAADELSVLELCRILDQSQPRVSRHLKLLADAGVVERFPDGAWVFYRLAGASRARALVDAALGAVYIADPVLAKDADRLAAVRDERSAAAAAYFGRNAERWDQMRSLYSAEADVERASVEAAGAGPYQTLVDLGAGTGDRSAENSALTASISDIEQASTIFVRRRSRRLP